MTPPGFSPEVDEALRFGRHDELMELLTQEPTQIDARDSSGYSLVHYAVMEGNDKLLGFLLDRSANVNVPDSAGMTPLHHAAKNGQVALARQLVRHGANLEQRDQSGMTPLMWASASRSGNAEAMSDALLAAGAKPDLFAAVMLDRTAEAEGVLRDNPQAARQCEKQADLLRTAIVYQNVGLIELLVQHGISPNAVQIGELTPLSFACSASVALPVVEKLLELGADPNSTTSQDQRSAIALAFDNRRDDLVALLRRYGARE